VQIVVPFRDDLTTIWWRIHSKGAMFVYHNYVAYYLIFSLIWYNQTWDVRSQDNYCMVMWSGGTKGHIRLPTLPGWAPILCSHELRLLPAGRLELVRSCRHIPYQLDRSWYEDDFYILASTTSNVTEDRGESTSNFLLTLMFQLIQSEVKSWVPELTMGQ